MPLAFPFPLAPRGVQLEPKLMRFLMLGAQLFSKRLHLFLRRREFPLELIRRALQSLRVFDERGDVLLVLSGETVPRSRGRSGGGDGGERCLRSLPIAASDTIVFHRRDLRAELQHSLFLVAQFRLLRLRSSLQGIVRSRGHRSARRHASPSRGRERERGASLGQLAHLCLERLDELIVVG